MDMFGWGKSLSALVSRKSEARRGRLMERVLFDLPGHLRPDMGIELKPRYFVPRMLGE
jgi:hypothetical protein